MFLIKLLNTTSSVDNLLVASKERVAFVANVDFHHVRFVSRMSGKTLATSALYFDFVIVWVYFTFHNNYLVTKYLVGLLYIKISKKAIVLRKFFTKIYFMSFSRFRGAIFEQHNVWRFHKYRLRRPKDKYRPHATSDLV